MRFTNGLSLVAALLLATGCPGGKDAGPGPVTVAHEPPASTPKAAPAAIPAAPPVVRSKVEPLPLDVAIDRGDKPASSPELVASGMKSFQSLCASCHGAKGDGAGPAAWAAQPRPRNFTKGIFKLHTNDNGSLPTDEDLFDTITRGMGATAMPPFRELPPRTRWELVAAVKELAVFKDEEEEVEVHFFRDRPASKPLDIGQPVAASPDVLGKGKGAYLKLDCNKCHGATGDASGASAADLKDDWGEAMWPRNFQEGRCRGVTSIRNYVERINTGLSGTPMAAFGNGQLTEDEKWALGHYLASLRVGVPVPQPVKDGLIAASRNGATVPIDLRQPRFWMDTPVHEVALEGDGPKTMRVSVQRDAANVALLLSWDDPIAKADRGPAPEDFLDGVTVELAASGKRNVLEWRGEWQRDGRSCVEETPATASKLRGVAKWQEGAWHVLFVRPLAGEGDRIPLESALVDVKIEVRDRDGEAKRSARSGQLKLGVP